METEHELELLFEAEMELDEEEAEVRSRDGAGPGPLEIVDDQRVRLLLRENRLALLKGPARRQPPSAAAWPGFDYYDITLVCQAHAHPQCRFSWVRLIVDLSDTGGAQIRDMSPREVKSGPVELETKVGLGLKFEVASVGLELAPERTTKRTVYYPEIVTSGVDSMAGWWDFRAVAGDDLHVDRELRLLVAALTGEPVNAKFHVQAEVTLKGWRGYLPLTMRKPEIIATYPLT